MRATRRTFRTAAIATGAIAALAVPTTAAFASDAPPNPHGQVAPDDRTGQDQSQGQDNGQDQTDQDKSQDQKDQTDQTDKETDTPKPGSWESLGTTDLGKGWTADIEVNASARTAKATISLDGAAKGSLTAYEKAASTSIDGNTFTLTPDGKATAKLVEKDKEKDKDKPVPGSWVSKGTTDLGKGWTAKVDVNASARSAKAEIRHDDSAKGSLKAYIDPAKTKIDGNTFTLSADGTITRTGAKPTPPKPDPKPNPDHKRTLVRQYTNLGGSGFDAKVYKVKSGYEADMIAKSPDTGKRVVWDTIKQSGHKPAYGQHNGAHFVLNPDGTMRGWTEGKKQQNHDQKHNQTHTRPQTPPKNGTSQIVPKGGVKAGAEGVHPAGDSAPLMAAGGGMAALGAAGLGFAMHRRKRND
ncbi:hypothetical protein ABZ916_22055 [Streptomyces sp. NPDC046853]|uniref:hypothetical protein n=1 Tax=Streptomyces sp. NPDC046853 TaxID=3154920 RepID=UPI0033F01553